MILEFLNSYIPYRAVLKLTPKETWLSMKNPLLILVSSFFVVGFHVLLNFCAIQTCDQEKFGETMTAPPMIGGNETCIGKLCIAPHCNVSITRLRLNAVS